MNVTVDQQPEIVSCQQKISDSPGSLERLLMNLRRRKFELLHMDVSKEDDHYCINLKLRTNRPDKLKALLNRLWDVRKCQNLVKKSEL